MSSYQSAVDVFTVHPLETPTPLSFKHSKRAGSKPLKGIDSMSSLRGRESFEVVTQIELI